MFKSIRAKLILFSLSLILVTIIPVVVAVDILIENSVHDTYLGNVSQQVATIEQLLGVFYDELDNNLDMLATGEKVKKADNTITGYMSGGGIDMTPSQNGGIEQIIYQEFENYANTHPGTLYVFMGTKDGGYVQWPQTNIPEKYDPRIRPWYKIALGKNGKIVRTDPYTDAISGLVAVSNVRTFKNNAGEEYGIMAMDVSFDKLVNIMKGVKIGNTGYAVMLHKNGLILADPKFEKNNLKNVKDIGIEKMATILDHETASFETRIDQVDYQVDSFQFANTDWIVAILIEKAELSRVVSKIQTMVVIITFLVVIFIGIVTYIVSGRFIRPINLMVEGLKDIAQGEGDLTMRLSAKSKDEIGEMARWFNTFVEKLQGIIQSVAMDSKELKDASTSLESIAGEVFSGAGKMSENSTHVATASEQMSSNLALVASSVEESSTNISMVSAATEEMTSTVTEIASNTEKTRSTSNEAVERTQRASKTINELSQSAQQIGNVVETITDISEQTNLLALNATIEAARAGDAGKGFAVVASEIKELARQTAEATQEIKAKIQGIQSSTQETVSEIEAVTNGITGLNGMIDTVAAAVEEQSVTTREIANNVSQAAFGIQEATDNMAQSSGGASEIARDIAGVSNTASDMSESSNRINNSAAGLSSLAARLRETVNQFKV